MPPDSLSSTDGAGREKLYKLAARELSMDERPEYIRNAVDVVLDAAGERTRVLEEYAADGANAIDRLGLYEHVPATARRVAEQLLSLAAVAVEDGGPATDDSLAGTRARVDALADQGFRLDGSLWVRFADVIAALEPSAAGTPAAEPPHDPEERT